ncbi:MAG: hypothetical protein ACHQ15_08000, partial [Candidatus Limnocylindrales bacterium]
VTDRASWAAGACATLVGGMRVRFLELRLLAGLMVILWLIAGLSVVVGYHPGGPADLWVRASAMVPAVLAAMAIVWPPIALGDRAAALIAWLSLASLLVLIPTIGELLRSLAAGGRQTLLPSPETAYALLAALVTTCLFVGLGIAREMLGQTALRRRRLLLGTIVGLALASFAAAAFGGATLVNDVALRDRPPATSAWGPTDPAILPAECNGQLGLGAYAAVDVTATGDVDGQHLGSVVMSGRRSFRDEAWQASYATAWGDGQFGFARVGAVGWSDADAGAWVRLPSAGVPDDATLDDAVVGEALSPAARVAAEDRGIELVGGARARHCRTAISGAVALDAFPALRWLTGGSPLDRVPELDAWRGDIDWWVFGDGNLGMATVTVSGQPGGWPISGLRGTLSARLTALDRDVPQTVTPPGQ